MTNQSTAVTPLEQLKNSLPHGALKRIGKTAKTSQQTINKIFKGEEVDAQITSRVIKAAKKEAAKEAERKANNRKELREAVIDLLQSSIEDSEKILGIE